MAVACLEVYNLSAGKSLPQWLAESKKKKQPLSSWCAVSRFQPESSNYSGSCVAGVGISVVCMPKVVEKQRGSFCSKLGSLCASMSELCTCDRRTACEDFRKRIDLIQDAAFILCESRSLLLRSCSGNLRGFRIQRFFLAREGQPQRRVRAFHWYLCTGLLSKS